MRPDSHELYARRRSRNVGVGLALAAFVLLTFAVTVVKLSEHPTGVPRGSRGDLSGASQ